MAQHAPPQLTNNRGMHVPESPKSLHRPRWFMFLARLEVFNICSRRVCVNILLGKHYPLPKVKAVIEPVLKSASLVESAGRRPVNRGCSSRKLQKLRQANWKERSSSSESWW